MKEAAGQDREDGSNSSEDAMVSDILGIEVNTLGCGNGCCPIDVEGHHDRTVMSTVRMLCSIEEEISNGVSEGELSKSFWKDK